MRWIKLTRGEIVGSGSAVAAGIGLYILWSRTHHLDPDHGGGYLLMSAIILVLGGGALLALELIDRLHRPPDE
jgi:hypothetical protein